MTSLLFFLTLFLVSGIVLGAMFGYRMWEISTGRVTLSQKTTHRISFDAFCASFVPFVNKLYEYGCVYFKLCSTKTLVCVSRVAENNRLLGHANRIVDTVKGRGVIVKRETVSTFLRAIAEHKAKNGNIKR